ncbi:uncharacterized protein BDW43DRAFT_308286 [Aspergillus alliaceus]|uniref:uncharacterized protein n=1 Tax=Petromyces alliaceus TaxID=209559 RepID=UPI0012A4F11D|nr:uncharacterized protein BDW43DRAFT_308286 [Aspergillus alliaceus]KAB8236608.1 hypothetical protein BDW43DRAFT_308286 [Aspergillus alliaceus]
MEVVATQDSVNHMATQLAREYRALWDGLFSRQIDTDSFQIGAKKLKDNRFSLEGHTFETAEVGHSDTDETTFLHSPLQSWGGAWLVTLTLLESYNPAIVVASPHSPGAMDGAFSIGASKEYTSTFSQLVQELTSAKELYD